jgi:O-acetylserine/cysteine efflux transporter
MALGASITAYGLWYYLIGKYEVNRIVPMTLLSPVLAVGFAVLILDEPLTLRVVLGGLLTLAGVAMIQFLRPAARVPALQP